MKDVAQRADVSVATVSRVLNEKGQVRDETRRRVMKATRALNYAPNGAARSLKVRQTHTLGALLPDLYGEFFTELIRGVDQVVNDRQYHLITSGSHDDERELEGVLRALRGRVDGLLVMSSRIPGEHLQELLPKTLPVVTIMGSDSDSENGFGRIGVDNYEGARAMVTHLAGHGHERIATITGPADSRDARQRLRGYRDALDEAEAARDPRLEIEGDYMQGTGHRLVSRFLALDPMPTAIFAANDAMAMGVLSALHEAGLDVPGDMAVAGFDDIPSARYMAPSLSTVHVPVGEIGELAARQLIAAVEEKGTVADWSKTLSTTLALRASCGCNEAPA